MSKQVSIVQCDNYEPQNVEKALRSALEPLGGMKSFVREGAQVLLKVNMLRGAKPEEAITTHPAIVESVAKLVIECGGKPFIGDSPGAGYPYIVPVLKQFYKICGYEDVAKKLGIECNLDLTVESVSLKDSLLIKKIDLIKPALESDVIINLPKAKTHIYMFLTGATKNLFGLVPGFQKPGFHESLKNPVNFAKMLLDIATFTNPSLTIMDAIVGMEGDGPAGGEPRNIGTIIAGIDPTSIDIVISHIMGMDPKIVPTISEAVNAGLSSGELNDIEILGEKLEYIKVENYKLPRTLPSGDGFDKLLDPFQKLFRGHFTNMFSMKPAVIIERCVGCESCKEACPVKAITMKQEKAQIDYRNCIRCYCCHEMCPHKAIKLERSFINRLIRMVSH